MAEVSAPGLAGGDASLSAAAPPPDVPDYYVKTYWWAYLHPSSPRFFDHEAVVSVILWGNEGRLRRAALQEIAAGDRVLQAGCVYGTLSRQIARHVGGVGGLDVVDLSPVQVANCRRKLQGLPKAAVRQADAAAPGGGRYDVALSFFLLHELTDGPRRAVVDGLLDSVGEHGRAVFVDYHEPWALHPLRPVMALVFALLEPFAITMWRRGIKAYAAHPERCDWHERQLFGGLYQVVVARRKPS